MMMAEVSRQARSRNKIEIHRGFFRGSHGRYRTSRRKECSLEEMLSALKPKGVGALDGFAIMTETYWRLLEEENLRAKLENLFAKLDPENLEQLAANGHEARTQILQTPLPDVLRSAIRDSYCAITHGFGGAEILKEVRTPKPAAGPALVRVTRAASNSYGTYMRNPGYAINCPPRRCSGESAHSFLAQSCASVDAP